jgi:hypothetical protein
MCACGHIRALHRLPVGGCRLNGCRCEEFTPQGEAPRPNGEKRTVAIEIPDGYVLRVELIPVELAPEPAPTEEAG